MLTVYIIFNFNCHLATVIKTQKTLSCKEHESLHQNKAGPEAEEHPGVAEDRQPEGFLFQKLAAGQLSQDLYH